MDKHAEGCKLTLLKRFRRDVSNCAPNNDGQIGSTIFETLSMLDFFELMLPISYLIFSTSSGTMVPINDRFLLAYFLKKDEATVIEPIALTVIIITSNYVTKIVMNKKST